MVDNMATGEIRYPEVPKLPIVMALDTSQSMETPTRSGKTRLDNLKDSLSLLLKKLSEDPRTSKSAEIAFYSFGGDVKLLQDFKLVEEIDIEGITSQLKPYNGTPLFKALKESLNKARERREFYKRNGIPSYVPWVWILTDGEPTDSSEPVYSEAIELLKKLVSERRINFFIILTGNRDDVETGYNQLSQLISKPVYGREGSNIIVMPDIEENWRRLALWISKSISTVSRSRPGESVAIEKPEFIVFT